MSEIDASKLPSLDQFSGLLSDRVYQALRGAIVSMDFFPGEIIRKAAICEHLGVSRSPVADALTKLSGEGLVDIIPQSVTRVTRFSMQTIREESFLREALEVAAVAKAAEERTETQLARISRCVRMQAMLVEDGEYAEFYRSDEEFHQLILDCTGISRLPATIDRLSLQVQRIRLLLLPEPGRAADTVEEHRLILHAIKAQDVDAAKAAMRTHLRQLLKRLEPLEKERPGLFVS